MLHMLKRLVFFDTETTGNTLNDFMCQLAYKVANETFVSLYQPPIKIPPEASAVHHISNRMLEGAETFQASGEFKKVKELFEHPDTIMVAHNAPFDLSMIEKEGIEPKNFICTLRVARHLDKDEKIDNYKLQYLRYLLDFEIDARAHDALGDVLVLEELFNRLKKKITSEQNLNEEQALEKMVEISSHPSIFNRLNFGKYKGKKLEEVLVLDRGWLEWLLGEKQKSDKIDEDWIYTLKHYLEK